MKNSDSTKCWQECGETCSHILLVGRENGTVTGNKAKHTLRMWSSKCIPGYYPREVKTSVYVETCVWLFIALLFSSVHSVVSDSLWPQDLQHARLPCPSPTPGACSNPCPSSQWCHPTISSSVVPFSFCLQSFPASGSFPVSQFSASGGQSTRVSASASVLPMNAQDWSPLGLTGLISLQSKGLSRVFSNTTVQKHQFFGAQLSL